jgi:hypothetical protein
VWLPSFEHWPQRTIEGTLADLSLERRAMMDGQTPHQR